MALQSVSGHLLNVGDRVKMDIENIRKNCDMDGVEFTATGKNYWRYMNEHPDEVYTVTAIDFAYDDAPYILSGYMGDNNWAADELIVLPEPSSVFEVIKNMTREEMKQMLLPMVLSLCEDGVPSPETVGEWLDSKPCMGQNGGFYE